ncbi:MAG: ATP synthase F1 subunit delta [Candidatus Moranbacteria bacterium]|nr:ATP synthase F1 subunit delta [Candidatus Moranbacteria bacterium]
MKISTLQYASALFELTENKTEKEISEVVLSFAEQLKKDGQLKNADKIMEKFSDLYNSKNEIVVAQITTSQKPENLNVKEIEEFVKNKYGAKSVELKIVVDENIKGGIVIRVGDEVMDASVGGQLEKLRKELVR